tara:strand:- start:3031 stop:3792 length:762 start_codon:yes stop_codon:yes gene_type:complete
MKIIVLGSGSSGGVPLIGNYWGNCDPKNTKNRRTRVSVYIEYKNNKILIDTSPELRQQALENNITSLDAVFWTHAHADHTNGIDDLRQFLWKSKKKLSVYAAEDTMNALKTRFDYIFNEKNSYFQPPLNVNVIKPGNFQVNDLTISSFEQKHGYENILGFRIGDFAYTPDVKEFPKASEKYLYNLKLWIVDCVRHEPHYSHSHFDQTIEWIKKYKPQKALLTHLGAWLDYDELLALCPSNVEPAYDGQNIILT